LIVAIIVVIAIVVMYYYIRPAADGSTPAADGSTPAADGSKPVAADTSKPVVHTITYVEDPDVKANGGTYWVADAVNTYSCPTGYTSTTAGFCILPKESAAAACTADDSCRGYLTTGSKHYWSDDGAAKYAQLTKTGVRHDDLWAGTTYYKKIVT
jgi:hypothetical protein